MFNNRSNLFRSAAITDLQNLDPNSDVPVEEVDGRELTSPMSPARISSSANSLEHEDSDIGEDSDARHSGSESDVDESDEEKNDLDHSDNEDSAELNRSMRTLRMRGR